MRKRIYSPKGNPYNAYLGKGNLKKFGGWSMVARPDVHEGVLLMRKRLSSTERVFLTRLRERREFSEQAMVATADVSQEE